MQLNQFMEAVMAYGLKPHDLLPNTRMAGGREFVTIQRNERGAYLRR